MSKVILKEETHLLENTEDKRQNEQKKYVLTSEEANIKLNNLKMLWEEKLVLHTNKEKIYDVVSTELNKLYAEPDSEEEISRARARLLNASNDRYKALVETYTSFQTLMILSTNLKNQHIEFLKKE